MSTTALTHTVNPWTWQDALGFSQGVLVEAATRTLYAAGQGAVDDDGRPVHAGDMLGQLRRSLDNVETVLTAAAMSLRDIVRYDVYTTSIEDYLPVSGELAQRFGSPAPAGGVLVQVERLAHPEMLVEIRVTAAR